ncbi:MAG: hypothetical protein IJX93_08210 [Clostridia bacterium]|nr:hypothetical protein [Clostridia bacterium]MBQ8511043.1 hypothetical protein [Clostridia bacterium]
MRWDRKLTGFAIAVTILLAAAAVCMVVITGAGVRFSVDRIGDRAAEGFESLLERVERTENVSQVIVNRRGKFEEQDKYDGFDSAWLAEMELAGYEYDADSLLYDFTVKFALRAYDTENVYRVTDPIGVYTKFSDECVLYIAGDLCYVSFLDGGTEYRFVVTCAPLTEWLAEVNG